MPSDKPESSKRQSSPSNPRRRYTLEELLQKCDPDAPLDQDREWLDSPPVGRELI
jgi:hypothetical protein